ncbi:MAG: nitrogenase component 1, partial [Coriobacteriales bacterium]|nr:nitrogenase component 1 [Coriobacteriales bacterium]
YSHTVMPIGARNTALWFRGIAALVGKEAEAEEYIEREYERVRPQIERVRERLQGKRVFLCGGTGRSFAAAALIDDFGMKLIGMQTPTYDEDAQFDIEHLNGIHGDFVIDIANMQPFEQVNLVNRLKPDVFIGQPGWTARFGIPTTHVLDIKRPTMGYNGLVYLGDKIAAQIENPSFNVKLSRYARHPYKASWFESDPFKFIKVEGEGSGSAVGVADAVGAVGVGTGTGAGAAGVVGGGAAAVADNAATGVGARPKIREVLHKTA